MQESSTTCAQCGYNLHGLDPRNNCPECGYLIGASLRVGEQARFRQRAGKWIGLYVCTCIAWFIPVLFIQSLISPGTNNDTPSLNVAHALSPWIAGGAALTSIIGFGWVVVSRAASHSRAIWFGILLSLAAAMLSVAHK